MHEKIDEILGKIANDRFIGNVWVGDHYSIKDLRKDLEELKEDK